ncbi:MAG: hypothetical protein A2046_10885 [Bacteroidetes bacterium GWA2_30_7]|nr:MAG: hypothetical protein A2046_10885 [Bacteroidetes bacterium GWA2_30_7]
MDSGILKLFRQLQNKSYLKPNKKLFIFLFFLVLSSCFWLLNILTNDFVSTINFPVKYKNFPIDKVVVNELPQELQLQIKASGFMLVRLYLTATVPPILFDINSFYEKKAIISTTTNIYIITKLAKEKIQSQLESKIEILEIYPDTIFAQFATVASKIIAIKPNLNISFEQQYMLNGNITVTPDSINVSGPSSILDTLQFVETTELELEELNKTVKKNVFLQEVADLKYSIKRIVIEIPIDKFTETSFNVPISILNIPENVKLKMFPNEIRATFMAPMSKYSEIKAQHFSFYVDFNETDSVNIHKLKVYSGITPELIHNLSYKPIFVDYIVEK